MATQNQRAQSAVKLPNHARYNCIVICFLELGHILTVNYVLRMKPDSAAKTLLNCICILIVIGQFDCWPLRCSRNCQRNVAVAN